MTTMAEKYAGSFNGEPTHFNIKVTDAMLQREKELEARVRSDTKTDELSDRESKELNLIEFIKSANDSLSRLGDGVDDVNQNNNLIKELDIVYGITKELGIDLKNYYQ